MPFRDRVNQPLIAAILFETLFDLRVRSARALKIALVHHDDVGQIEHDNLLKLEARAVIRIHHEHRLIDQFAAKGKRFLSGADCLNDDVIKIFTR